MTRPPFVHDHTALARAAVEAKQFPLSGNNAKRLPLLRYFPTDSNSICNVVPRCTVFVAAPAHPHVPPPPRPPPHCIGLPSANKRLLDQGKLGRMEAAQMMLEFQQAVVPRKDSRKGGGGGGDRDTKAKDSEEREQGAGREEEDDADDDDDGDDDDDDDGDDEPGMAPPGLAKLVGDGAGSPQAPANAAAAVAVAAAAVATAPVVVGGFRGGGGRGDRAAPLGTPHLRGGSNGSGARPPAGGGQQQQRQQYQQQQQQQQVEQQYLEAENQQEKLEQEEYEMQQQQQQQQQAQQHTATGGVPVEVAEGEVFAATRSPSVDYDTLAPPGV